MLQKRLPCAYEAIYDYFYKQFHLQNQSDSLFSNCQKLHLVDALWRHCTSSILLSDLCLCVYLFVPAALGTDLSPHSICMIKWLYGTALSNNIYYCNFCGYLLTFIFLSLGI
jgi:hypothetical protein